MFQGLTTAIITPFKNDQIDLASLEKIIEYQIKAGVKHLVVAGSTGEGNLLTKEEYLLLLQESVKIANKRVKIVASCSSSSTKAAILLANDAEKLSVDGLMCAIPHYVKPTQDGIYLHYHALHRASQLPIILYTVPSRIGVDFADDTILRLVELPRIVALKDAGLDMERPLRLRAKFSREFTLLSGDDSVSLGYNALGGNGCISVASNIAPLLCKQVQDHCQNGYFAEALKIQLLLLPLYKALFLVSNPICVKYAAFKLGLCLSELRLPLVEANEEIKRQINSAILSLQL